MVRVKLVDLAAGTITLAQVQEGLFKHGAPPERYGTRFPAVPVHLACEVGGVPLVGGRCQDPALGPEVRPILLYPDATGRATLTLPGPITAELTTRLTQADGLHIGLPPLTAITQRWCAGLPPGACDADADADLHPARSDCADNDPARHPGVNYVAGQPGALVCPGNPGDACAGSDVDCNGYTFDPSIATFGVARPLGDGAGMCEVLP